MLARLCLWMCCGLAMAQGTLEKKTLPLAGEHRVLVQIDNLGRYSIRAASDRPVNLQLLDAMSGTLARAEAVNPRVDALLEPGTYALRVRGPEQGEGTVALTLDAFDELHATPPVAEPHTVIATDLADHQSRAYWFYHSGGDPSGGDPSGGDPSGGDPSGVTPLYLEVAGRGLADVRLWVAGNWQAGLTPKQTVIEPVTGQPMNYFAFYAPMQAGYYKVVCYGGPPQAWAAGGDTMPLYLRHGLMRGGASGYHAATVSPFGHEQWLINTQVNHLELRTPQRQAASLHVTDANNTGWWVASRGYTAEIPADSKTFHAQLTRYGWRGQPLLRIKATPGTLVETQYVPLNTWRRRLDRNSSYLVAGYAPLLRDDGLDFTAALVDNQGDGQVVRSNAPTLSSTQPLIRRVDLQEETHILLQVTEPGTYRLAERADSRASAHYELVPFGKNTGRGADRTETGSISKQLVAGLYRLRIVPQRKGVLDFAMTHVRAPVASNESGPAARQLAAGFVWDVSTPARSTYGVEPAQNDRQSGLLIETLPLTMHEGLALVLLPGEAKRLPLELKAPKRLLLLSDAAGELRQGDNVLSSDTLLSTGRQMITVQNNSDRSARFQLQPVPRKSMGQPPTADQDFAKQLPRLTLDQPLHLNVAARTPAWVVLAIPETGLYRLESSGLLSTSLMVMNRANSQPLVSASANGIGRNGLILATLRAGEYLLALTPNGQSAGRAGLHLDRAAATESATLTPEGRLRISQAADQAVRVPLEIANTGTYRLQSLQLEAPLSHRFDDADGWPITEPGSTGPLRVDLVPGRYTLTLLPQPVAARRLVSVTPMAQAPQPSGKGPHPISFNQPVEHLWRLGEPDLYQLHVPATADVQITLSRGMRMTLTAPSGEAVDVLGGESWRGELKTGMHQLAVVRLDEDDRFPYSVTVQTEQLLPGVDQTLAQFPGDLEVRVPSESLAAFSSWGARDVAFTLLDQNGAILAEHDDSRNDWNPRFTQRLSAERYRLRVTQTGAGDGPVTLSLRLQSIQTADPQTAPFQWSPPSTGAAAADAAAADAAAADAAAADAVMTVPVRVTRDGLYRLQWQGEIATVHWEVNDEALPITKGSYLPLATDSRANLRLAGMAADAEIRLESIRYDEKSLDDGSTQLRDAGAYRLNVPSQQAYRASGELWLQSRTGYPLEPVRDGVVNGAAGELWLVSETNRTTLEPLMLRAGQSKALSLSDRSLHLQIEASKESLFLAQFKHDSQPVGMDISAVKRAPRRPNMLLLPTQTLAAGYGAGPWWLHLWPTQNMPTSGTLQVTAYPKADAHSLGDQPLSLNVPAQKAVQVDLAAGQAQLNLTLPQAVLALAWQDGGGSVLSGSLQAHQQVTLARPGGSLFLINTSDVDQPAVVAATADQSPAWQTLSAGTVWQMDQPGTQRITLTEPPVDQAWWLFGALASATFTDESGRMQPIQAGTAIKRGGWLDVEHRAGFLAVWQGDSAKAALFGTPPSQSETLAESSQVLAKRTQRWRAEQEQADMLVLVADDPLAIASIDGAHQLLAAGETYLLRGQTIEFLTRPLTDEPGRLRVQRVQAKTLQAGKDNPRHLLGSHQVHHYRVDVRADTRLGIGFQSEGGQLQARLLDNNLQPVAQGPYILQNVAKGTYHVLVQSGDEPVIYRAIAYGMDGPKTTIPDNILSTYLNGD